MSQFENDMMSGNESQPEHRHYSGKGGTTKSLNSYVTLTAKDKQKKKEPKSLFGPNT